MYTSISGNIVVADNPELSKQDIRNIVWKYLTDHDIGRFPLPLKNRIPNFEGAAKSGHTVAELPCFTSSHTVKVNPDKAQEEVRFLTLQARKRLLVPTPRLSKGLFNLLENEGGDDAKTLRRKAQSEGVKNLSKPISLEDTVKVDLIVIGSVAVSKTGRRIGKGEGFADFEYAMMKTMKAVDDSVPVVTAVHDTQVFDDLPEKLFLPHDVPVDIIVTPTQVINVTQKLLPKPRGIYWHLLSVEKFLQIPILRVLYDTEKRNGVDVSLLNGALPPDEEEIDNYQNKAPKRGGRGGGGFGGQRGRRGGRMAFPNSRNGGFDPVEETFRGRGRGDRGRFRGWGRGRGSWKETEIDQDQTLEEQPHDLKNIQVTINISKQNKIVRRSVEETDQRDRVATTKLGPPPPPTTADNKKAKKKKTPPTFSVFVGGIPKGSRLHELKAELSNHGVRPSDITWKGTNGYAFLNFHNDPNEVNLLMDCLKGLSLRDKPLKVDVATKREQQQAKTAAVPATNDTECKTDQENNVLPPSVDPDQTTLQG